MARSRSPACSRRPRSSARCAARSTSGPRSTSCSPRPRSRSSPACSSRSTGRAPRPRSSLRAALDEGITDLVPAGIGVLAAEVVDEHELAALGRSRGAATIERLALDGNANGELRALEAFPRLISLDLENLDLGWRGSSREATLAAFAGLEQ